MALLSCRKDHLVPDKGLGLEDWYLQQQLNTDKNLQSSNGIKINFTENIDWQNAETSVLNGGNEITWIPVTIKLERGKLPDGDLALLIARSNGVMQSRIVFRPALKPVETPQELFNSVINKDASLKLRNTNLLENKGLPIKMVRDQGEECMIDWYLIIYAEDAFGNFTFVIDEFYLYSLPCDGMEDSGSPSNPPPTPETPCENMNNWRNNDLFTSSMNSLRAQTQTNREQVIVFNKYNYLDSMIGAPGVHEVSIEIKKQINAWMHSHFEGGIPIFSNVDMMALYNIYIGGAILNKNTYIHGVTTFEGTEYFLKIENDAIFSTFASGTLGMETAFDAWSTATVLRLENYLRNNYSREQAYEKAFLESISGSGLQLYKKDFNSGNYKKINLSANNTVLVSGCN